LLHKNSMKIIHETYTWKTCDKLSLFGQCWYPEKKLLSVILLIHGFGEHSQRYEYWASKFVEEGHALITFDLRGHGKSEGKRGDAQSYDCWMKDIDILFSNTEILFPGIPKVLYGHSFGGNLAANYALQKNPQIKGLILSSPWLKLAFEVKGLRKKLVDIFYVIWPSLIQASRLQTNDISGDPVTVEKYKNDPLNHDRISVRAFFYITEAGKWALKNADKLHVPLLLMHGSGDRITSYHGSIEFAEKAKAHTTLKIWDGMYHELHNETIKEEVFDFMKTWLINTI